MPPRPHLFCSHTLINRLNPKPLYLSWIIPAHNEQKRIEKTVREVDAYLRSKNFPGGYEILVVNNASDDNTTKVVERMQPAVPHLKIYDLEGRGKGSAVKHGMLVAKGSVRLFSDADNSTAPRYFDAIQPLFAKGFEVVISSRDPKDAAGASRDVEEPWYREVMGNAGNLVIQAVGGAGRIWDTQNGFKAFTAKAAQDIFSHLLMDGFSFDIEMLALARRFGFSIGIIPVKWRFDPDSKVTLADYIRVLTDVFKIRWNLISNKYKMER